MKTGFLESWGWGLLIGIAMAILMMMTARENGCTPTWTSWGCP